MSQTLRLSDELYQALQRYAEEHQQTPEEALASLLRETQPEPAISAPTREPSDSAASTSTSTSHQKDEEEYLDPWEGFYGAFEAKYPDLIERHDYYIGRAALETHEDEDDSSAS